LSQATGSQATICLCMIVRNEAAVIERCLASVRHLISSWVISDTGSTDGTQDLIRQILSGVPGELHEEPWVNFGHNRTLNITHAYRKADYLLLLDADMVVRQHAPLPALTKTSYMLRHSGDMEYRVKRVVRADMAWRYEGSTHEYITTSEPDAPAHLDALEIHHYADGGSRRDKFVRDELLLRQDVKREPDNPRTVFYLAQTLKDLGKVAEAISLYERRAKMGGWAEEIYYSLFQAGVLKADSGDWPAAMDALIRAWEWRPSRLEACYELASGLRLRGSYHAACSFARAGLGKPVPDDWLFIQPWVYQWGLLFEYSIASYWTGDTRAALRACDQLLEMPELPNNYREQTLANREFAVARLAPAAL
jgi:tetratricopeptide (TPR) repeat protein